MSWEIVARLKARIAELNEENAVLSAAVQVRMEIYDSVIKWRSPTGGISDRDLLQANAADAHSRTPRSSNVLAFRKATPQTVKS
jgi:hypothetical protein